MIRFGGEGGILRKHCWINTCTVGCASDRRGRILHASSGRLALVLLLKSVLLVCAWLLRRYSSVLLSVDVLFRMRRRIVHGSMRSVVRCAIWWYGADSAGIPSRMLHPASSICMPAGLDLPCDSTICDGEVHLANHRPAMLSRLGWATLAISSRRSIVAITSIRQPEQLLEMVRHSAAVSVLSDRRFVRDCLSRLRPSDAGDVGPTLSACPGPGWLGDFSLPLIYTTLFYASLVHHMVRSSPLGLGPGLLVWPLP